MSSHARAHEVDRTHSAQPVDVVTRAAALAPLIEAEAPAIERARRITEPVLSALREAGLLGLLLPRSVGGPEVTPVEFLGVIEAIARADASTAWVLSQTSICGMAAAVMQPEVARRIFPNPASMLAWGAGPDARATPCEGGYRVTGKWAFGSGTHHAAWLGGLCTVTDAAGTPQRDAAGNPVKRTALFPAEQAVMTDIWHVMGLHGTGSDAYTVADLLVPEDYTIRFVNEPLPHAPGLLYLVPHDSLWAGGFACISLSIARSMLESALVLAREKTPRGFKRSLAENGGVQSLVAHADVQLRAARLHLFTVFADIWASMQATGGIDVAQRMQIRLAASHAIDQGEQAASAVYRAMGTSAVFANAPFERRMRDMHMVTQHLHGRLAHYETVGQFMLGMTPDLAFL